MSDRIASNELLIMELPEAGKGQTILRPNNEKNISVEGFLFNSGKGFDYAGYSMSPDGMVVAAVADGFDNLRYSDVASFTAVKEFIANANTTDQMELRCLLEYINRRIRKIVGPLGKTSFTGVVVDQNHDMKMASISIGDSRAYYLGEHVVAQITTDSVDDSFIVSGYLGSSGLISEKDVSFYSTHLSNNWRVALMTDGISDMIDLHDTQHLYSDGQLGSKLFSIDQLSKYLSEKDFLSILPDHETDASLIVVECVDQ